MASLWAQQVWRVTVVHLESEYGSAGAAKLRHLRRFLRARTPEADAPRVLLNCRDTCYFGCAFMSTLQEARHRLTWRQGRFALCCPPPFARQILAVTQLDTLWEIYESLEDGLSALAPNGESRQEMWQLVFRGGLQP